jgi:hypothetical protein
MCSHYLVLNLQLCATISLNRIGSTSGAVYVYSMHEGKGLMTECCMAERGH